MKQGEQRRREEQRLTLWAFVHFGGAVTSWREFCASAGGQLALIPLGAVIFFTLYGFCRGDRVLDLYRRLRNDYPDRPTDDDDRRR